MLLTSSSHFRISDGISFLIFTTSFIAACSSSKLEREEYIRWIQDPKNGLHTLKESNGFVFDLQYQPAEFMGLQSGGHQSQASKSDGTQYYMLTVSLTDPELDFINNTIQDNSEKQEKLYYFSYLFQNDIQLEENGKSFPCVLFHFERPQDLKHGRTFLLGFENQGEEDKEAKLVIQSEQFGSLPIRIKINKENIPTLKI
jgi:hypothetical protein